MSTAVIPPAAPPFRRSRSVVVEKRSLVQDKMVVSGESPGADRPKGLVSGKPRKKPSSAPSSPRPAWHRVLSVASKNAALLAVLLWLGSAGWSSWQRAQHGGEFLGNYTDYQETIADVKESLKNGIRMLQLQVDIVDKKISNEVGAVSSEIGKLVEAKRVRLEQELQRLEARTDGIAKSLQDLKAVEAVTRTEFDSLLKEVEKVLSSDRARSTVDLDKLRALVKELAEKEIEKHAADGIARPDYALASGGAQVIRHSEPYGFGKSTGWLGKTQTSVHGKAVKMLEPSFGQPGQCFPLHGSSGFVEIRLRDAIVPEAVTLEHVHKSVAFDLSSAPKDCRVSGWYDGLDSEISRENSIVVFLTEFSYDLDKGTVQTFDIHAPENTVVNMIRLDFDSNHGHPLHTCIYRFRVHGHLPGTPLALEP